MARGTGLGIGSYLQVWKERGPNLANLAVQKAQHAVSMLLQYWSLISPEHDVPKGLLRRYYLLA